MPFERLFKEMDQERLVRHLNSLSPEARGSFEADCAQVDWPLVQKLLEGKGIYSAPKGVIEPVDPVRFPEDPALSSRWKEKNAIGIEALQKNRVAVVVVAGGQGTRLGLTIPKGCFEFAPVSKKTLFQLHAEKILALEMRYQCRIPFLVMVSRENAVATRAFFQNNDFFGLPKSTVRFFAQGMLPAVDAKTKQVLLTDKGKLALSPNGHGGLIPALKNSGLLDELLSEGRTTLYYFQVDNPLIKVGEPYFIGEHLSAQSQYSAKTLKKADPLEKIGLFARFGNRTHVIEYSDLPHEIAHLKDEQGEFVHWAGSPAIHVFDLAFLNEIAAGELRMPYHHALKTVSFLDENGKTVKPAEKNAIKFESFIFDAMPLADRTCIVETIREQEFAPIKNPTGIDSIASATGLYINEMNRWIRYADLDVEGTGPFEISPLVASDEFELKEKRKNLILKPNGMIDFRH